MMNIALSLVVFAFKVLNVLDVILQKFGIKLLKVTKERVLKGKIRIVTCQLKGEMCDKSNQVSPKYTKLT